MARFAAADLDDLVEEPMTIFEAAVVLRDSSRSTRTLPSVSLRAPVGCLS